MPQPLSHFDPKLGFILGSGNTPHDPQMALAAMSVITLWAQIEANYATLVARIASADPVTVTAVFHAMVSAEARQAALFAAAKESLTPEEASLIMAVIDTFKASRNTRNAFAHHLWGEFHERREYALLANPKTTARYTALISAWDGKPPQPTYDRSEVMVWQQPDFDEAVQVAQTAQRRIVQLSFTFDHPAANQVRQELLADPQIQRRYDLRLAENAP